MATTRQLVSLIKEEYDPKISETRILYYLNWAQNTLFQCDCAQQIFVNNNDPTFPYPILHTTEGQLDYEIDDSTLFDSTGAALAITLNGSSTTVRRVKSLFVAISESLNADYNPSYIGEQFNPIAINSLYANSLYNVTFYTVPNISFNMTNSGDAKIVFAEDPGTTTDRYYVEAYLNPVELTSKNIDLSINGEEWEMALIDGVVGRIEDFKNGTSRRLEKFLGYWTKKFGFNQNIVSKQRAPLQFKISEC